MYTSTVTYENKPDTINLGVNTDHLGNVRAVVSDIRQPVDNDGDGKTDEYQADVKFYADYYPFGMLQPGRSFNAGDYRYLFNGMEQDQEWYNSAGTMYTTTFRQYDPRIGRWLSIDPELKKYPSKAPFIAFSDNPIIFVDPFGDADFYTRSNRWIGTDGKDDNKIYVVTSRKLKSDIKASSKQGQNYTEPVSTKREALFIPSSDVREEMNTSITETEERGREQGGHVTIKNKVIHWDEGPEPEFTRGKIPSEDKASASITPFKVDKKYVYKNTEDYKFMWHVHPNVTVSDPQDPERTFELGSSEPSGEPGKAGGDIGFSKFNIQNYIVFGARDKRVTYYDPKGERGSMRTKKFMKVGDTRKGRIYRKYERERGDE